MGFVVKWKSCEEALLVARGSEAAPRKWMTIRGIVRVEVRPSLSEKQDCRRQDWGDICTFDCPKVPKGIGDTPIPVVLRLHTCWILTKTFGFVSNSQTRFRRSEIVWFAWDFFQSLWYFFWKTVGWLFNSFIRDEKNPIAKQIQMSYTIFYIKDENYETMDNFYFTIRNIKGCKRAD